MAIWVAQANLVYLNISEIIYCDVNYNYIFITNWLVCTQARNVFLAEEKIDKTKREKRNNIYVYSPALYFYNVISNASL